MKKIILSLILLFSLTTFANYDPIINIPDANFKAKLLQASPSHPIASTQTPVYIPGSNPGIGPWVVSTYIKIDTNNDGEIQTSEALNIKWLNLNCIGCLQSQKISSLEGISSFINLQSINCSNNQIAELNVQGLANLKALHCGYNQLTSLNLQGLTNLQDLVCFYNSLNILNVQGLNNLWRLECSDNQLTNLNLQGLSNLLYLYCYNNQISNLDVQLTNLQIIECYSNQLTNLNVQGLNNLQRLICYNNQLPNLNVQGLTSLQTLECYSNQLTNLNVQGLNNLQRLICYSNQLPNLNVQGLTNLQTLECYSNQLTNLNVQGLSNLQRLICYNNQLPNLNVQGLTNLQTLECYSNQLTNLNVQGLNNLQRLICYNNQLTTLNVQGLTNLQTLNSSNNQLENLAVQGLPNLYYLYCANNQLTSLNAQGLTNLVSLNCTYNQLSNLNVQDTNLNILECTFNQLTSLNVQGLNNLQQLYCEFNQLTSLFIKNGYSTLQDYDFSHNANLQYVCCSDNQLAQVQQLVDQYGYTNCQINSYCSFTPGGNYNTISGQLIYDANQNGCDANDDSISHRLIKFSVGTNTGFVSTNNQGNYNAYVGSGTHTLTPQIENPILFNITPPNAQVSFSNSNNNTQTRNFCITPNGEQTDVEVIFAPLNPARPGFDADYKIVYRNIGNQPASGQVSLNYMGDRIDLVSSSLVPTNQTTNQLTWSYQNLLPFETRTINLRFNINSPTETPPVNNGDILNFTANMTPVTSDINPANNNQIFNQTVVGSFDPNDKTCLQGNTPGPEFINQYVHYLIRFENTGTFFAENVVIRDDIDLAKFDINSLVVLDASHSMLNTRILNGNRVEFIFEGIQLPFPPSEERHGYVLFKIKTKSNLTVGSTFSNKANIYFDYNWPIITNDEVSTITLLGQPSFKFSEFLSLYPNPANDMINISAKAGINLQSIEIYNTMGQLLMALPNESNKRSIDVSHLNSGTYIISVNTDKGKGHTKFVKAP